MGSASAVKEHRFQGLTDAQVVQNRQQYGANVLTPPRRDPWWKLYLSKFDDPVIRILIIAALIAIGVGAVDGHYVEGLGIIIAVLLATTLAFLNEYNAGRKFDVLNQVNDEVPVKVIRNGDFVSVPRRDLVVDDIVLVESGEEIPGDGVVLEAVSMRVDESRLTGESMSVRKRPAGEGIEEKHQAAYAANVVLKETFVSEGYGYARITAVGDASEIGKTARAAAEITDGQTPLNRQLERLSQIIGVFGFSIATAIFVILTVRGVMNGEMQLDGRQWLFMALLAISLAIVTVLVWLPIVYDAMELIGKERVRPRWLESAQLVTWLISLALGAAFFIVSILIAYVFGLLSLSYQTWLPPQAGAEFLKYFMISVTIIVVAVPEGLAMSVTLSLAYSMRKMMAANNLVRKMHACETIGAATVICSDKTGTLTRNEMSVAAARFSFRPGEPNLAEATEPDIQLILEAIGANTTAQLGKNQEGNLQVLGNPTEGALLVWLDRNGIDYNIWRNGFDLGRQWTFTTELKFMGTAGTSRALGRRILFIKGAPEIVLGRCDRIHRPDGLHPLANHRSELLAELKGFQSRGMRTLAFAYSLDPAYGDETGLESVAMGMIWMGFVAIADPVRDDVPEAVQACREAGIQVKIVTGDIAETARDIAEKIGLLTSEDPPESVMTGPDFGQLDDRSAATVIPQLKVLSRARPLDKLRLVKLLKQQQQVVAVTGDGTNDAPALNHADVGLAMGKTGTAVAKEASDIILLDDSFTSIVNAVMWGRSLYENIQRFVLFQLTINVTALGIAFLGPFIGIKLPLTVIQMLWINLIMDTLAALALATEPPHRSVLKRPPRDPQAFILTKPIVAQILVTAALAFSPLVAYLIHIQRDGDVSAHDLSIFFTLFVFLQFWNLFNARCLGQSHSAFHGIWENKAFLGIAVIILVGQVLIVQYCGEVFRTQPLTLKEWLQIFGGASIVLWLGEIVRLFQRLRRPVAAPAHGQ